MKRSDRYLLRELGVPFLIGATAVLLMLVGNLLFAYLEPMLRLHWPLKTVLRLLILNVPTALVYGMPVITALTISLATYRLARDNELTALRATGVPLARLFLPFIAFGAVMAASALFLSEQVAPRAWREQLSVEGLLGSLQQNPIDSGLSFRADGYAVSFAAAQQLPDGVRRLNRVIVFEEPAPGSPSDYATLYTTPSADYARGVWTLGQGAHAYWVGPDGDIGQIGDAAGARIRLSIDFAQAAGPVGRLLTGGESFAERTRQRREALRLGQIAQAHDLDVRRWFGLSLPMMCLAFGVCSPPLALRFARSGSFTGILLSIACVFVGWNLWLLMRGIAHGGLLAPALAATIPDLLFLLLGVWLLRSQEGAG